MGKPPIRMDGITLDITCRACQYVPYTMLERSDVTLQLGGATLHLTLLSKRSCMVYVPPLFLIMDSYAPGEIGLSVCVKVGTSFAVMYNGNECEVRLGRRITVRDVDSYEAVI